MKNHILLSIFILITLSAFSQSGDGWNNRELIEYESPEEVARESITFKAGYTTAGHTLHAYINPDLPLNGGVPVTDGEFNMNYIRTFTPIHDNATTTIPEHSGLDYDQWSETIQYFDGLGRPSQTVAVKVSAAGTDIIQPVVYDDLGRQKLEYLPYAIAQDGENGAGGFRPDFMPELESFYSIYHPADQEFAFAEKEYDGSPLNRVTEQYLPGAAWRADNGHPTSYTYETNTDNEIPILGVQTDHDLEKTGFYPAATLFKNTTTDENESQSIEYKDKQGRVVAKMVAATDLPDSPLTTYYVYDDFGDLRYVVPPEAALWVKNHASGTIGHISTTTTIKQLCYYYQYDERRRMAIKKLPGAEPVYLVYNKRDQLVLSQDGNMRSPRKWQFTKYDVFNRPVMTGIYQHSQVLDQEDMQTEVNTNAHYFESYDGSGDYGYSNQAFPATSSSNSTIHTVTWYDNYDFRDLSTITGSYTFDVSQIDFYYLEDNQESEHTKGMVTGTMTSILPNAEIPLPSGLTALYSAIFYDRYGRVVQTITDNHLGGQDIVSHQINFTGDILLTKEAHSNAVDDIEILHEFAYDNGKRLTTTTHQINNENPVTLSHQKYDELGRLRRKYLHGSSGNALQTLNYAYNIRSWLTNINDVSALGEDMFALSLGYTTGEEKQYNGNIASMQWNTNRFGVNTYNFDYDGANRITEALFSGTGQHNTSYTYDKNGNITSLTREGRYGESSQYGGIDDLSYTYQGNQLQSVHDLNGNNTESEYYQNNGFTDNGSFATTEFTYDANGNMRTDENKNLEVANYNHLNLPQQLNLSPPQHYHEISYLYTALGQKLCKATHIDYTTATTTNYVGSFIYHDDQLQSILTPEGRVVVDGSNYEYQYFLQDHLGNTRITFNSGGIIQEDSYYPYGMNMAGLSHISGEDLPNKYRYNGKELQDDFGLGWYDYGARFYDAQLGRWHVVDALAEKAYDWTPYRYAFNNPINILDPDGNYEIDAKTAKKYPQFAAYLKNISTTYANKPQAFRETFKAYSQLSDKQITSMLTFGQGPKISVTNLDNGNNKINGKNHAVKDLTTGTISNANNGKGLIELDDNVVGKYENASTQLDKQVGEVLVESTLLHESTHFGDYASDGTKNTSITKSDGSVDNFTEIGKAFEKAAYGQDIGRGNVDKYVKDKQPTKIQSRQIQQIPIKEEMLQLQQR
jgi:RHS repeat-associated protein